MFGHHLYVPDWLLSSVSYYDYLLQYPVVLLNLFIILLSFHISSSLCRTYTLNIAIPTLITGIYNIIRHFVDASFAGNSDNISLQLLDIALSSITTTNTLYLYEIQATLTMMLTYFGCVKPILYKNLFSTKIVHLAFFIGHVVALSMSAESFFERAYPLLLYNRSVLRMHTVLVVIVKCTFFTSMFAFYISTLARLRAPHLSHPTSQNAAIQKSRLRAVAIYCTPPNIFLILAFVGALCSVRITFKLSDNGTSDYTSCTPMLAIVYNLVTVRLLVNSVCAMVAFVDYRRSVVDAFMKTKNLVLRSKTNRVFSARNDSTQTLH
ncbi:hypothetical protein QR680_006187 [Steinernema hermaphroditum]|uniref:Uncharacterized protein n=1 Tax=Steinernema hermaphroditum TaxID=289476 RepID=A0AA39HVR6_9BILA|nr:hypothetical protein QR680_006187 [Steinernema hermaphroditum]